MCEDTLVIFELNQSINTYYCDPDDYSYFTSDVESAGRRDEGAAALDAPNSKFARQTESNVGRIGCSDSENE